MDRRDPDSTSQLTDQLVRAAQAGRPAALTAVYRRLAPAIAGYLTVRGATDPEGLTSDVFLVLFRRLPDISGGAAGLRTLAFSIAHARLVDELRRRQRRPAELPFAPELDDRRHPSAEDEALQRARLRDVRTLLDRLPAEQAEAITLRLVADLSVEQTAQAMGRSTGAVKQLQRRGLLTLRRLLAEQAADECDAGQTGTDRGDVRRIDADPGGTPPSGSATGYPNEQRGTE